MEAKSRNEQAAKFFSLYSIALNAVGLWPLSDDTFFRKLRVVFSLLQVGAAFVAGSLKLMQGCGTKNDTVDTVILLAICIMVINKLFQLNRYRKRLSLVISASYTDWTSAKNSAEVEIMNNQRQEVASFGRQYYIVGISCVAVYICKSVFIGNGNLVEVHLNETEIILEKERGYVLPGSCVYNSFGRTSYYFIIFNQMIQIITLATVNLGVDIVYVSIIAHVCGQIDILIQKMSDLGKNKLGFQNHKEHLDSIIQRHQQLMLMTHSLEHILSDLLFVQMVILLAIISFGGTSLLICLQNGDMVNFVNNAGILLFMFVESYVYTFPADNLANCGEKLLRGLYNSHWYQLPPQLSRNLVFIMMRINIPPYLTVGKYFNLTRNSYTDIIKTGASYLSVLRLMIIKDEDD